MSAFIEVHARLNSGGTRAVLVNSAEIRKVHAREPAGLGTVLVWAGGANEYSVGQLEVSESFEEVSWLLGAAEPVVYLHDGEVRYRSLP